MPETESTGLQLPGLSDSVRADLLKAQQAAVTTVQQLPTIKIMPQGVGLWEFSDTETTPRSFIGVILNHHPRNVLWDKPFEQEAATENEKLPACSSNDGKYGTPREGFAHEGLNGLIGDGILKVECRTCPYNEWGTGNKLIARNNPKGKAVANQRAVYVQVEGHNSPYQITLPPTSLGALDEYIVSLTNRGIPVQAVITEFSLVKKERGNMKWSIASFSHAGNLENDSFVAVMAKRKEYENTINPQPTVPAAAVEEADFEEVDGDDDLPF